MPHILRLVRNPWFKRVGVLGFLFFFLKGMVWLVIFYYGADFLTRLF